MKLEIHVDDTCESPRDSWDNLGTMLCNLDGYDLGDASNPYAGENGDFESDFKAYLKEELDLKLDDVVYLPIYAYLHGGITIKHSPYSCSWDSGMVGYSYVTKEDIRKEYRVKNVTKKIKDKVIDMLESELEIYKAYLEGNCYGFIIKDDEDNDVDSCWGFIDDLEEVKKNIAEHLPTEGNKELVEQLNNIDYEDLII